jgi:hypothetical protein
MPLKITDNRLGKSEDNRFFQVYLEPARRRLRISGAIDRRSDL